MTFATPPAASGASTGMMVRAPRESLPRFRPTDFRPLSNTASAHREEVERLSKHESVMLVERDRLLAGRAAMMGTRIDPMYLDGNDHDRAALATDLDRLAELRAQLEAALPALEQQEAAELAQAQAAAERCRARAEAFHAKVAATYAPLAEPLAALLRESAAIAGERAAAARTHAAALRRAGSGALDFGRTPTLHRGVLLPALDGKPPLFDGRVFHRQIPVPHGLLAVEVS